MAITAQTYGAFPNSLAQKLIDIDSDAIKVMLCTSSYTPNLDTDDFKSDVTNEVAATGGYTAGGITLTGVTMTYDAPTNTWKFDANDVTWSGSTITARYAVIYDSTPASDATRPLMILVDFGANFSSTGADFTIAWAAGGICTFLAA